MDRLRMYCFPSATVRIPTFHIETKNRNYIQKAPTYVTSRQKSLPCIKGGGTL